MYQITIKKIHTITEFFDELSKQKNTATVWNLYIES